MPRRLAHLTASALLALAMLFMLVCAVPVSADDSHYPDPAANGGDPYSGSNVQQEGTHAPKNADADETPAPFGVVAITGTFTGACVAVGIDANGNRLYQQTLYTVTPAGFVPGVRLFTDTLCTAPVPPQ